MYITSRITDASYSDIKKLYQVCFGLNEPIDQIRRKYATQEFGEKNVGFVAKSEGGDIAAYYGVFPLVLTQNLKDFLVAQSGDTMTSLDHQKKGLFTMLAKETYTLCKELNISLVFGFPNQNSLPGFVKKLNWVFIGNMQKFNLRGAQFPFCELAFKYKWILLVYNNYYRSKIKRYEVNPETLDEGFFTSKDPDVYEVKKDSRFFKYKLSNPYNHFIKFNGFYMLVSLKIHLRIGLVNKFEPEKTSEFINAIQKLGKILKIRQVHVVVSDNHWLFKNLNEYIKSSQSLPIGILSFDERIKSEDIQFTVADYDTF